MAVVFQTVSSTELCLTSMSMVTTTQQNLSRARADELLHSKNSRCQRLRSKQFLHGPHSHGVLLPHDGWQRRPGGYCRQNCRNRLHAKKAHEGTIVCCEVMMEPYEWNLVFKIRHWKICRRTTMDLSETQKVVWYNSRIFTRKIGDVMSVDGIDNG